MLVLQHQLFLVDQWSACGLLDGRKLALRNADEPRTQRIGLVKKWFRVAQQPLKLK